MAIFSMNGSSINNGHGVIRGRVTSTLLGYNDAKDVSYNTSQTGNMQTIGKGDSNSQIDLIHNGTSTPTRTKNYIAYETAPTGSYVPSSGVFSGKVTTQMVFSTGESNHIVYKVGKVSTV